MRDEIKLRGRSMEEVRAYNGLSLAEKWGSTQGTPSQGYTYREQGMRWVWQSVNKADWRRKGSLGRRTWLATADQFLLKKFTLWCFVPTKTNG